MKSVSLLVISTLFAQSTWAQDKIIKKEKPRSYYNEVILPALHQTGGSSANKEGLTVALERKTWPASPADFKQVWHTPPVSQGNTGTCWCFSTTSFYESEVKRISGIDIKLSEMYIVYWQYVERAKYFVAHRGNMSLGEGSEANAVAQMMQLYGIVPRSVYEGRPNGKAFYSHDSLFNEITGYLAFVKKNYIWNEEEVVANVKAILNYHLGQPPVIFKYNTIDYSPMAFMQQYLRIKPAEYINFMSLMEYPFNAKAEYDVPDNWWNSDDYWNVNLDDFMKIIEKSVENGYSVAIGGDVSEMGLLREYQIGIIPSFDIPSKDIDDNARQFRFSNGSTTDDHAMHIVGIQKIKGEIWYLVKDSGSGARTCGDGDAKFGYYFFHEDYIRLKIMNITIHQDALSYSGIKLN